MKILGLRVDGLRKLTAVEMEFADKGLIQFRGKNKQGKTTILDSFEILLKGAKHIEDDMITHDRKKAEIIGTIGNYEIKRVITSKSTRLEVKHKAGDVLAKPQEFLDKLINELTFNPRPFLNKTSEQKLRFMMDFLGIDFTAVDGKIKQCEDDRLFVGRVVKQYGDLKVVEKVERVSVVDLIADRKEVFRVNGCLMAEYDEEKEREREGIRKFNDEQENRQRAIDNIDDDLKKLKERASILRLELEAIQSDKDKAERDRSQIPIPLALKSVDDVEVEKPTLTNIDCFDEEIANAEETNIQAEAYETYFTKKKEKAGEKRKYEDYTTRLEKLRNMKKMIFRNAKVPVEGLEIREGGVYHNDIHSENWSEAEGLRISSELCLAMDPKLRALFLDKGENYDADSLKELETWALENDLQIFITIVDSTQDTIGRGIFYIEEGEIV